MMTRLLDDLEEREKLISTASGEQLVERRKRIAGTVWQDRDGENIPCPYMTLGVALRAEG